MNIDKNLANNLKSMALSCVFNAKSGHIGMPLGMSDLVYILYKDFFACDTKNPESTLRDRFVISNGHGSTLLYSLLFLLGYEDISIEDLRNFRKIHSKTAGHPEYGHLAGVETTTGPLGQGIANAVGMAIAAKKIESVNGIGYKVYCTAGDGCLMEGISYESISIAGTLELSNLVLIFDDNSITIDGTTDLARNENIKERFKSANWNVIEIDGHNYTQIHDAYQEAQNSSKPTLIKAKTTLGNGWIEAQGTSRAHGSIPSEAEYKAMQKNFGFSDFDHSCAEKWHDIAKACKIRLDKRMKNINLKKQNPDAYNSSGINDLNLQDLTEAECELINLLKGYYDKKPSKATRQISGDCLKIISKLPNYILGSADLSESNCIKNPNLKSITSKSFDGNYINYGIREHAMAGVMNGLTISGFRAIAGTFLVFSDYMRPSIRLAAMMNLPVIYVFTHDSIGVGEDGPTHQPIEHLDSLRLIPNLLTIRPANAIETIATYLFALRNQGNPIAICLSRQNLNSVSNDAVVVDFLERFTENSLNSVERILSGYIAFENNISNSNETPDYLIIATGSEVDLSIEISKNATQSVKVLSIPCVEMFNKLNANEKQKLLSRNIKTIFIEAGTNAILTQYAQKGDDIKSIKEFGRSGKYSDIFEYFGFTADLMNLN